MTLRTALRDLKAELEDRTNYGSEKAGRLNDIAINVNWDVSLELPANDYVRKEVIPLLVRAMNTIKLGERTGAYVEYVERWVYDMNCRIDGLRKYCAGKAA